MVFIKSFLVSCVIVGGVIALGFSIWYGAIALYAFGGLWAIGVVLAVGALTIIIYSCELEDIEAAKREAQKLKDKVRA